MRFEATYYQPSGRFQPVVLLHALGAMLLCAIAGCGYQYLNDLAQLERVRASSSLILLIFGMVILVILACLQTERVVRVGHVRHHRVAVLLAVAISPSTVLASYAWAYFRSTWGILAQHPDLSALTWVDLLNGSLVARWLALRVETGWTLGRTGLHIHGVFTYLCWAAEALILIGVPVWHISKRRDIPYCEKCQQWTKTDQVDLWGLRSDAVEPLLRAGDIDGMLALRRPKLANDSTWVSLQAHTCPGCQKTWLTVAENRTELLPKGEMSTATQMITENLALSPQHQKQLLECIAAKSSKRAYFDDGTRERNLKFVYDGPVGVGTDENLRYVYGKTQPETKSQLNKLTATTGSTVFFFDFLPLGLDDTRSSKIRFHLYALAGGAPTADERALVLKGVNGIIFVADANKARLKENIATFEALKDALATHGYVLSKMPLTVQLNRADAKDALTADELRAALKLGAEVPIFPANSATGVGVFNSLKTSAKQVLSS